MNKKEIILKTIDYVKPKFENDTTGHDWWHTYRVWQNAIHIGKSENANMFVVQLAALLHDVADWKFHGGNDKAASKVSRDWLESVGTEQKDIMHICNIVENVSFKGSGVKNKINTIEGKIVQDADRLDAIGAIGIARTFAYGGHDGRAIYDPNIKPTTHETFEKYKNAQSTSINHFYEKLLLLKNLMNTKTGRKMAQKRHKFIEKYLEEFYKEWEGKD